MSQLVLAPWARGSLSLVNSLWVNPERVGVPFRQVAQCGNPRFNARPDRFIMGILDFWGTRKPLVLNSGRSVLASKHIKLGCQVHFAGDEFAATSL